MAAWRSWRPSPARPTSSAVAAGRGGWLWGATGVLLVALAVAAAFWDAAARPGPVLCAFRRLTGVACPGCGLTRAAALAVRGEWAAAFALHPALPLVAVEALVAWLAWGRQLVRPRPLRWPVPAALGTAGLLLLLWLVRLAQGTLPA